jgi:type IV secretory pathway VirB10-like protein
VQADNSSRTNQKPFAATTTTTVEPKPAVINQTLPAYNVAPFIKIWQAVKEQTNSELEAARVLGVCRETMRLMVRENKLSHGVAFRMLSRWKMHKAKRANASNQPNARLLA